MPPRGVTGNYLSAKCCTVDVPARQGMRFSVSLAHNRSAVAPFGNGPRINR
jgi:hypothetical protein